MTERHSRITFHHRTAYRIVEDHIFLVNGAGEFFVIDDPVGCLILETIHADGEAPRSCTMQTVTDAVVSAFEVDEATAGSDAGEFLQQLVHDELLVWS